MSWTSFLTLTSSLVLLFTTIASAASSTCSLADIQRNGTLIQTCEVLCKPAGWTDLVVFYIGNYFAHIATVRAAPGEAWQDTFVVSINALFFPSTGLLPAVKAIATRAVFTNTALQTAARAGALYMVVKEPQEDEEPREAATPREDRQPTDAIGGEEVKAHQIDAVEGANATDAQSPTLDNHELPEIPADGDLAMSIVPNTNKSESVITAGEETPVHDGTELNSKAQRRGLRGAYLEGRRQAKRKYQTRREQRDAELAFEGSAQLSDRTVHGQVALPKGYIIGQVPADATFEGEEGVSPTFRAFVKSLFSHSKQQPAGSINLAQDYSFLKAAVALGQALFAISTLYKTRGAQIQQFGYVAYGFTVLPYAFMSTINLISNIVCPEYSAIFLVENEELRLLRERLQVENRSSELVIEGAVGKLSAATEENIKQGNDAGKENPFAAIIWQVIMIIVGLAVYLAVVGGLTGFSEGHSTHAQRVWIMTWYCFGVLMGPYIKFFLDGSIVPTQVYMPETKGEPKWNKYVSRVLVIVMYATPAIGGFVVVGQEVQQYGICEEL